MERPVGPQEGVRSRDRNMGAVMAEMVLEASRPERGRGSDSVPLRGHPGEGAQGKEAKEQSRRYNTVGLLCLELTEEGSGR